MMEERDLIESGLIESYVLGFTTKAESTCVEEMAKESEKVSKILSQNQTAIEKYAYAYQILPTTLIKEKIFNQINMDKETKEIEFKPVSPFKTWWVAASLVITTASLLGNVYYGTQNENLKSHLSQVTKSNNRLTYENLINKSNYRSASEQLSLLHKHGNKTTHLEGLEISKESSAMIYWNSETKDLYISIDNLPKEPAGKQFQLWAIVNGNAVDAGIITINAPNNSIMKMKAVENAQAFAISLEKIGGSSSPTKDAIYAMGTI